MLIIAHRLASVIDADRILVMDAGTNSDYDHPFKLLVNEDRDDSITSKGLFAQMIKSTGEETSKGLFKIA